MVEGRVNKDRIGSVWLTHKQGGRRGCAAKSGWAVWVRGQKSVRAGCASAPNRAPSRNPAHPRAPSIFEGVREGGCAGARRCARVRWISMTPLFEANDKVAGHISQSGTWPATYKDCLTQPKCSAPSRIPDARSRTLAHPRAPRHPLKTGCARVLAYPIPRTR